MKCLCIKTDPLQTLEVGKEYDYCKRYNKVHILGVGLIVSEDIFNEHFETMMILDLPLKKEWYNMIEANIKTEEYRAIKPYWVRRFCKEFPRSTDCHHICGYASMIGECFKPTQEYTHVCFRFGYTRRTMLREIESITIGYGKPEWGAPTDKHVFIIKIKKGGES